MQKEYLYGIIGLLVGILLTVVFASNAVNTNNQRVMDMMGMRQMTEMMMDDREEMDEMSMEDMMKNLRGRTGDEFDMEFMDMMTVHHQGAIDMARLAQESAMHDEIKSMANDIISAQTKEIEMMKDWQTQWRY